MSQRRRRSEGVRVEGLEGRRMLAGWAITNILMADTEVRAGEEFVAESFDLAAVGGGDGAKYVNVRFALSRDAVAGNEDDLVVGSMTTEAAEGRVAVPTDWPFWMPATTAAGTYRLVATASRGDMGHESEGPYGSFVGPEVSVAAGGPVDFTVTGPYVYQFRTPGPFVAGGSIVVGFNVQTTELRHRPADARVVLSVDDVVGNGDDVVLGDLQSLAEGTHDPMFFCFPMYTVTIPANVAPGAYRLVTTVDPGDEILEANEENNSALGEVIDVASAADYLGAWSVTRIDVGDGEVRAGGKIVLRSLDLVAGERADNGLPNVLVDVVLSRDGVVGNGDDVPVRWFRLPAQAGTAELMAECIVPRTTEAGPYRLLARVTGTHGGTDGYAPYGTFVGPDVEVLEAAPIDLTPRPLVVEETALLPGAMLVLKASAQSTDFENRMISARFALSVDDVAGNADDIVLGVLRVGAGGVRTITSEWRLFLSLPQDMAPGQYRLVGVFDSTNEVAESDEGNNAVVGPVVTILSGPGVTEPPTTPVAQEAVVETPTAPVSLVATPEKTEGSDVPGASVVAAPEEPRKARLVAKVVTVRKAGKVMKVVRVTNVGTGAYRGKTTLRVPGQGAVKKWVNLEAGRHVDLAVKLAAAVKGKAIRVAVAAERP